MPRAYACPFFQSARKGRVVCDGCVLAFADKRSKLDYIHRFCGNVPGWESCTIAKELVKQEEKHEQEQKDRRYGADA